MGKSTIKLASIIGLVISGIALITNPLLSVAQGNDNSKAELTIYPGIISVTAPDDFSFDTIFLPPSTDPAFNTYKTLLPLTPGQVIRVTDTDMKRYNFKVGMSISNFKSLTNSGIIPFTNFAALTLANNTIDGIDTDPGSPPSATNDVTAPWSCAWNGQTGTLKNNCDGDLDNAQFTGSGSLINTDPTSNITSTDTIIPVGDSRKYEGKLYSTDPTAPINNTDTFIPVNKLCNYKPNDILHFSSGEYATVVNVPITNPLCDPGSIEVSRGARGSTAAPQGAGSGIVIEVKNNIILFNSGEHAIVTSVPTSPPFTQIETIRGVSSTTAVSQNAGTGIENIGIESSGIDIIVAPEPIGGRIGSYSVGLGIRALLEPAYLEATDYSGQITFSVYQCTDLSCI